MCFIPSVSDTARASCASCGEEPGNRRMVAPVHAYPCCCIKYAATAESTPPLMATSARQLRSEENVGVCISAWFYMDVSSFPSFLHVIFYLFVFCLTHAAFHTISTVCKVVPKKQRVIHPTNTKGTRTMFFPVSNVSILQNMIYWYPFESSSHYTQGLIFCQEKKTFLEKYAAGMVCRRREKLPYFSLSF